MKKAWNIISITNFVIKISLSIPTAIIGRVPTSLDIFLHLWKRPFCQSKVYLICKSLSLFHSTVTFQLQVLLSLFPRIDLPLIMVSYTVTPGVRNCLMASDVVPSIYNSDALFVFVRWPESKQKNEFFAHNILITQSI